MKDVLAYLLCCAWSATWLVIFWTHPWLPFVMTPPAYIGIRWWLRERAPSLKWD